MALFGGLFNDPLKTIRSAKPYLAAAGLGGVLGGPAGAIEAGIAAAATTPNALPDAAPIPANPTTDPAAIDERNKARRAAIAASGFGGLTYQLAQSRRYSAGVGNSASSTLLG